MDRQTLRRMRRQRAALARAAEILDALGRHGGADECTRGIADLTDQLDGRGDIDHDYPV